MDSHRLDDEQRAAYLRPTLYFLPFSLSPAKFSDFPLTSLVPLRICRVPSGGLRALSSALLRCGLHLPLSPLLSLSLSLALSFLRPPSDRTADWLAGLLVIRRMEREAGPCCYAATGKDQCERRQPRRNENGRATATIIIRGPNNQCGPPAKRPRASPLLPDDLFFIASFFSSSSSSSRFPAYVYLCCVRGIYNEPLFCYGRTELQVIFAILCKKERVFWAIFFFFFSNF